MPANPPPTIPSAFTVASWKMDEKESNGQWQRYNFKLYTGSYDTASSNATNRDAFGIDLEQIVSEWHYCDSWGQQAGVKTTSNVTIDRDSQQRPLLLVQVSIIPHPSDNGCGVLRCTLRSLTTDYPISGAHGILTHDFIRKYNLTGAGEVVPSPGVGDFLQRSCSRDEHSMHIEYLFLESAKAAKTKMRGLAIGLSLGMTLGIALIVLTALVVRRRVIAARYRAGMPIMPMVTVHTAGSVGLVCSAKVPEGDGCHAANLASAASGTSDTGVVTTGDITPSGHTDCAAVSPC